MNRQNKQWLITLLAAMMMLSLLSACGGNSGTGSTSSTSGASGGNTAAEGTGGSGGETPTTIRVWDWDETYLKEMIPEFNKKYPNIKVEYTIVNPNDYLQKLQSGIASGSDVPDVILGETAYRGKLFDLGVLENLEQAPYNLKRSELLDYLVPLMTNEADELVGVDQQIAPAGLAFRRDIAKQYLGTDDPKELEALLSDWNAFIEQGKQVAEKSGGKVTMFPGLGDAFLVLRGQSGMNYIQNGEIDLTSRMSGPLQMLFKMRDAGILGKHELWTPAWSTSMSTGENLFYPMAPWGPKWHISANDKDGSGRWGLVKAPGGSFTRGGTSVSIYKDSKVKEAAWAYIQFCYLSDEGTKLAYEKFGFTPGTKAFYENNKDLIEAGSEYDAFFGGQNLMKYFIDEIVPGVKGEKQTKYDSIVEGAFMSLYPLWTKDTSIDEKAAMAKFISEVQAKATDATVK
ncbi:ABC transporter substrate-binding protein [Paenibacillus sp. SYP-B4298]|uniref:ABC transporter substrate-binding protein n=1 Tax=Paenibacillus sp. SYP-B4298 TaxID=2996034 RepID=UPI0022DD9D33|nr:extracellular solute-binding protein [Paenibacillus sp. SYP-B4298]